MDLKKFGIKLYLNNNTSYHSRDFIPVFHNWIQNKAVPDHLLIDIADYSHIPDGPGILLVAHEGHFSLDQADRKPGILYMRKTEISGSFKDRFNKVLSTTILAARMLSQDKNIKAVDFFPNSFRFISNDRRIADNVDANQKLYTETVNKLSKENFPGSQLEFNNYAQGEARLAFDVNFRDNTNILEYRDTEEEENE